MFVGAGEYLVEMVEGGPEVCRGIGTPAGAGEYGFDTGAGTVAARTDPW